MKEIPVKCCSFNYDIEYIYKNGKRPKISNSLNLKDVGAWDTGNNKTYVTYSKDKGHASQMSFKTQNNVAYEILKMKFIANILC